MAEVGKPGTNWSQVSPEHRKKIEPIVRHYMKEAHPFTACVRDNEKRFGPDRVKRICAVVKDMGMRSTSWRKGGKGVREAADQEPTAEELAAIVDEVWLPTLEAEDVTIDELAAWSDLTEQAGLLEAVHLTGVGDLTVLEAAAAKVPLSNARRRTGESLGAYGARLKAGDRANQAAADAKKTPAKTRDGRNADFEKEHPRGRGGSWTLKQGAKGAEVRAVQAKIGGTAADGQFGPETLARVKAFQARNGLQVDGVIGKQTLAALRGDKDAKKVAVGKLTDGDRKSLRRLGGKPHGRRAREAASVLEATRVEHVGGFTRMGKHGPIHVKAHTRTVTWDDVRAAPAGTVFERDVTDYSKSPTGEPAVRRVRKVKNNPKKVVVEQVGQERSGQSSLTPEALSAGQWRQAGDGPRSTAGVSDAERRDLELIGKKPDVNDPRAALDRHDAENRQRTRQLIRDANAAGFTKHGNYGDVHDHLAAKSREHYEAEKAAEDKKAEERRAERAARPVDVYQLQDMRKRAKKAASDPNAHPAFRDEQLQRVARLDEQIAAARKATKAAAAGSVREALDIRVALGDLT